MIRVDTISFDFILHWLTLVLVSTVLWVVSFWTYLYIVCIYEYIRVSIYSCWTDFVLAWEEPHCSSKEESTGVNPAHLRWREEFLNKLTQSGLLQEQVNKTNTPENTASVSVMCPNQTSC